jgi:hypothetical protein
MFVTTKFLYVYVHVQFIKHVLLQPITMTVGCSHSKYAVRNHQNPESIAANEHLSTADCDTNHLEAGAGRP